MAEEELKDPKDDVIKVFEDDDVLIVSPLTTFANRYYGQKSPWYDESWSGTKAFHKNLESGGKIYYIINKKTGEKDSFYRDEYGQSWYNENSKVGKEEIESYIQFAPSAKKILLDLTGSDMFKKLRQFAKGQITEYKLELSDDLISDVVVNKNSLGDSKIIIKFDEDEDLFKMMDLSGDDTWFLNVIMSRDYDFKSSDQMWDDNKEGYGIFRWFNDENIEKLKTIASIVLPTEEFSVNNESYLGKLYQVLDETFSNQLDRMNWEFIDEYNSKASEVARKEISEEIYNYLESKGFELVTRYDTISISIADLIYMYSIKGMRNVDLKTLLESELEPGPKDRFGGWGEDYYEYEGKMDEVYLNNEFGEQLDKIISSLEDNNENYKNYFELLDKITSKYKLNTWYQTPKDKNILFQIKKIDPSTLNIHVGLRKHGSNSWDKTHSFTEENFNKFLYQPELFDIFDEK